MPDIRAVTYLQRAEECGRQAEKAITPAERSNWLELRDGWLQLAVSLNEAEPPQLMDGYRPPPKQTRP